MRSVMCCDVLINAQCDVLWRVNAQCDVLWCGNAQCDVLWRVNAQCDVLWRVNAQYDVMWCVNAQCDVMWCVNVQCDVAAAFIAFIPSIFWDDTLTPTRHTAASEVVEQCGKEALVSLHSIVTKLDQQENALPVV